MIVNANDAREFEATLTIDRLNNLTSQLTNYYKSNGSGMPYEAARDIDPELFSYLEFEEYLWEYPAGRTFVNWGGARSMGCSVRDLASKLIFKQKNLCNI